jgi:hypothetical protein
MGRTACVRTEPHIACCAAMPRREKHFCHHPTTVLYGSRSEWLLAVPYSENGPQGDTFHNHGRQRMRRPNSRRFQKKSSAGASNNGRIDGASVCVRARILLWRWLGKRCHMSNHYSAIPHYRELLDGPSYIRNINSFLLHVRWSTVILTAQPCRRENCTVLRHNLHVQSVGVIIIIIIIIIIIFT